MILHGPDVELRWRWPHFTADELRCHCACATVVVDTDLLDTLEDLRRELQRPMPISSGYRCASRNTLVSSTGATGPHTTGAAVDVAVYGIVAWDLLSLAIAHPRVTGIGVQQKGPMAGRFLHVDVLPAAGRQHPRPRVWSY